MSTLCEQIAASMSQLFSCAAVGEYVRIRTPFLYPDGDTIDIYYANKNGQITLTDLGETTRWLKGQAIMGKRNQKQRYFIDDICQNHNVEFFRGMLMLRVHPQDNFALLVNRLSEAAIRVADLIFTFQARANASFADDVQDLLVERQISYDRGKRFIGRSGRMWDVSFYTRTPAQSSFIRTLSTGSRAAAQGAIEHAYTSWADLSNFQVGPEKLSLISLLDDSLDIWTPAQINLLGDVSQIALWSKPDEFIEMISSDTFNLTTTAGQHQHIH